MQLNPSPSKPSVGITSTIFSISSSLSNRDPGLNFGGGGIESLIIDGSVITITATVRVEINGKLACNGAPGASDGAAGGSGGSFLIQTSLFSGIGTISTNGGNGLEYSRSSPSYQGRGGSGGRIAIYYSSSSYSGAITSISGIGLYGTNGGPGTIFLKDTTTNYKKLIVSNNQLGVVHTTISTFETCTGSVAWLLDDNADSFDFDEVSFSFWSTCLPRYQAQCL